MVIHIGSSQHGGHYTAVAEASNNTMFEFDDASVSLFYCIIDFYFFYSFFLASYFLVPSSGKLHPPKV